MFNILFITCIERNELLINLCVIYMNIYFFFSQVILFNFRQNKTSIKTADNKSSFLNKKYIERLFPDFNNSYKSFNLNLWSFVLNLPLDEFERSDPCLTAFVIQFLFTVPCSYQKYIHIYAFKNDVLCEYKTFKRQSFEVNIGFKMT